MTQRIDTPSKSSLSFVVERNREPVPVADRAKVLADPGFGRVFTDHMAVIRYTEGKGWHDAKITARKPRVVIRTLRPNSP